MLAHFWFYGDPIEYVLICIQVDVDYTCKEIKGALDNFSLIPQFFFFQKSWEIFIPLEVYTYVVTACLILLATST